MDLNVQKAQKELIRQGISVGSTGADGKLGKNTRAAIESFQQKNKLKVTGELDSRTLAALFPPPPTLAPGSEAIPLSWLPKASISRIIVHWTAGQHRASADDRKHYHLLWEGDGTIIRGIPTIDKNDAGGLKEGYAQHTLNCNTGSVGVSMCAMTGAIEAPFSPGPAPLTEKQWNAMVQGVAQLCQRYGIPVTDRTVLTHAEVQPNLGIRQRGKWDITRLPWDKSVVGHRAVGDLLRRQVAAAITQQG